MKYILVFLHVGLLLYSCGTSSSKSGVSKFSESSVPDSQIILQEKDSIEAGNVVKETKQYQDTLSNEEKRAYMQGIWAENENSNAVFQVKEDSIYYFENPEPSYYSIEDENFNIFIEGEKYSNKLLKLTPDSLVFISDYGEVLRLYNRSK